MSARRARRPARATEALVVRIHDYAETSAIAVLLTRDRGLVRAVAKGAKRLSNGYRGPLDKCVLYRARIARRGSESLPHLNSSVAVEAFPRLRQDPARFLAAALVLEVSADLMREDEPQPDLFRLTAFSLKVLDRAPRERIPVMPTLFLVRALGLSGHAPETRACAECGRPIGPDERPLLSAVRGGTLHAGCAKEEPGARSISPATLALYRELAHRPAGEILARDRDARALLDLRVHLSNWLEQVLDRRFRSAAPLERELARRDPPSG